MLHEKFHQYKMSSTDSITQHVAKVQNLAKEIKEAGDDVSDRDIMTTILSTLLQKFRNVILAWLSLESSKQKISKVAA